ncbi:MAG: hypothetical protein H7210_07685 [Pyrinomonadaceae bacterium]|nr:hypothetical protein [Phycisphaerales bacterium]
MANSGVAAIHVPCWTPVEHARSAFLSRGGTSWYKLASLRYRKARRESFKHAISLCQKYVPHAVQALVQFVADKSAPHSSKVSAATTLMKFSRESLELDDLAERLERLEISQAEQDKRKNDGSR